MKLQRKPVISKKRVSLTKCSSLPYTEYLLIRLPIYYIHGLLCNINRHRILYLWTCSRQKTYERFKQRMVWKQRISTRKRSIWYSHMLLHLTGLFLLSNGLQSSLSLTPELRRWPAITCRASQEPYSNHSIWNSRFKRWPKEACRPNSKSTFKLHWL